MRRETWAGIRSGLISGLLFPPLWILFGVADVGPQTFLLTISTMLTTTGMGSIPLEFLIVGMILGFVAFSLIGAGLGACFGAVFVKVSSRLPFRSTYLKSLFFGLVMYVLYSLPRLIEWRYVDPVLFGAIVADALIFAYAFNRWANGAKIW